VVSAEVVVVGGGAMGAATAWWLMREGRSVTLLEQFEPGHDRGSSHGRARIFRLAYRDPKYLALARRAQELWRVVEEESGRELLEVTGGLDHGPAPIIADLHRTLEANGVAAEQLARDDAADRWPGMRFDDAVLLQRDAGRLHADATVQALHGLLQEGGGDVRYGVRVLGVREVSGGVELDTSAGPVAGRVAVVAAGAWVESLTSSLPFAAELPAFRVTQEQPGYFRALDDTAYPSFLHHRGSGDQRLGFGAYGMHSPDRGLKVGLHGAGREVDPDERPGRSEESVRRLTDYVTEWFPGAAPEPLHVDSCLYTSTPDEEFVLRRWGNVVVCSPCSGHGFKFVPAIGEVVAGLAVQ
jgi:sarcosine oxidase